MTIDGKVPRLARDLNHGNIGIALRVKIVRADGGQTHANHRSTECIHSMRCRLGFTSSERNAGIHTPNITISMYVDVPFDDRVLPRL